MGNLICISILMTSFCVCLAFDQGIKIGTRRGKEEGSRTMAQTMMTLFSNEERLEIAARAESMQTPPAKEAP